MNIRTTRSENRAGGQLAAVMLVLTGVIAGRGPLAAAAEAPPQATRDSTATACGLKQYASLDLELGEDVYVPVSLNGHEGYMSLDLGSGLSTLHHASVVALGLKTSPLRAEAYISSARVKEFARFDSLSLGGAQFGKGTFIADPRDKTWPTIAGKPLFGTLGTEAFNVVDFELDLAHRKLNLFSQDHCKGNTVYWASDSASAKLYKAAIGTFYIPVEIEGRKIETTLAPSNETTTLTTDITRRYFGFDKTSPGIETSPSSDPGDDGPVAHYRAMRLTAPGLSVTNTRIRLEDPARNHGCVVDNFDSGHDGIGYSGCMNVYPMHLGRNVLSALRLYFATKEKMVYYTAANAGFSAPAASQ